MNISFQPAKFRLKEENGNTEEKRQKRIVKYLKYLPGTNFFFLYFLSRNVDHRFLQDLLKLISEKHKKTLSKMDTFPSAPSEELNTIPTTRQLKLEKRKKDEEGEREKDNEKEGSIETIEMKEMNEGNEDEQDKDEYEETSNETKLGAKPKRKNEFEDIHMAMSPSSQQPRELRPSNLPGQSIPKHHSKLPKEKKK